MRRERNEGETKGERYKKTKNKNNIDYRPILFQVRGQVNHTLYI